MQKMPVDQNYIAAVSAGPSAPIASAVVWPGLHAAEKLRVGRHRTFACLQRRQATSQPILRVLPESGTLQQTQDRNFGPRLGVTRLHHHHRLPGLDRRVGRGDRVDGVAELRRLGAVRFVWVFLAQNSYSTPKLGNNGSRSLGFGCAVTWPPCTFAL